MIITKEQQQALIDNYIKAKHNQDECSGFIDGVEAIMNLISNLDQQKNDSFQRSLLDRHSWLKKEDLEFALKLYQSNRLEAVKWLSNVARPHTEAPLKTAIDIISEHTQNNKN